MVWKAQPYRSMLVLVPQGCEEGPIARLVSSWVRENFIFPPSTITRRVVCIELVSDGLQSSGHVAQAISQAIKRQLRIEIDGEPDDFPSDVLQNAIEAANGAGAFPILIIQRFHAFASIRDGGMTSILARLRTLEGDAQLTTLAFSPIGYDTIRRMMDSEQPFLNSVYGDMHDEAVMVPLSRDDFVAEAVSRGVASPVAYRLFGLGGGPDVIFRTLLDLHRSDTQTLISRCAERAGPAIDLFLERAIPENIKVDHLLTNLALGRLSPAEEAFLLSQPLQSFLCKRSETGKVVCSSPIIARRIIDKSPLQSQIYGRCMQMVEAEDYTGAALLANDLTDTHPRLAAFRELVLLRGALTAVPGRGLLGIDWRTAEEVMKRLRRSDTAPLERLQPWLEIVEKSLRIVLQDGKYQRLQADGLTRRAFDPEVRALLLFMMEGLVSATKRLAEPSSRVSSLVNVPEAILQSLATGFCGIDYSNSPSQPPVADYDIYSGHDKKFVFPRAGQKFALSALLVVVPALLARDRTNRALTLIDPDRMRPLQQKLVDAVRNPASHTIADFAQKDAKMLEELCLTWINDWCLMENLASIEDLPIRGLAPNSSRLQALLIGD